MKNAAQAAFFISGAVIALMANSAMAAMVHIHN
jgi:hypothetical protein